MERQVDCWNIAKQSDLWSRIFLLQNRVRGKYWQGDLPLRNGRFEESKKEIRRYPGLLCSRTKAKGKKEWMFEKYF